MIQVKYIIDPAEYAVMKRVAEGYVKKVDFLPAPARFSYSDLSPDDLDWAEDLLPIPGMDYEVSRKATNNLYDAGLIVRRAPDANKPDSYVWELGDICPAICDIRLDQSSIPNRYEFLIGDVS